GGRPGLLRPGQLRRRDRDAQPRRARTRRPPLHAVLHDRALLADPRGVAHGVLRPADPPRRPAGASERAHDPAALGRPPAPDAPTRGLSLVPLGQVARRRPAARRRLRPLVPAREPGGGFYPPGPLRGPPAPSPPAAGQRVLRNPRDRRPRDPAPPGASGGVRGPALLPVHRLHRAALSAAGAGRRHRSIPRPVPGRMGRRAEGAMGPDPALGPRWGPALRGRIRGRPAVRLPLAQLRAGRGRPADALAEADARATG